MIPSPFHITFIFPFEEVCVEVLRTQSLGRVLSATTQKVGISPKGWLVGLWTGKVALESKIEEPRATLEDVGLVKSCEIFIDQAE